MKVNFKINITADFQLLCSILDEQNQKKIIVQTPPSITFNSNTINICKEEKEEEAQQKIYFMKKWVENPDDYSTYPIVFQAKTYELLPEVLFAIIINEIKKKIEKECIIQTTIIELPINDPKVLQRIKISLQGIKLNGIVISEDEEIHYDYQQQDYYLQEIIEKKNELDCFQQMLNKAKELSKTEEEKEKINEIDLNKENMFEEEIFNLELCKRFNTKQ